MSELDNPTTLETIIADLKRKLNLISITKIGSGLEFYVLKATTPKETIAIKIPKDRIFSNVNDAHINSKDLIYQEYCIMKHLAAQNVDELPKPLNIIEAAGFSTLIMSYVESDGSQPSDYNMGVLLAKIHTSKAPDLVLSAQENMQLPDLITARLSRRWRELVVFMPSLPELPKRKDFLLRLESIPKAKRLLHMDFRYANLLTQNGKIVSIVDWSNAIVGHPALEIARVSEVGGVSQEFTQGYNTIAPSLSVDRVCELIFRLDTATMLALVFFSEEPNPAKAKFAAKRVLEIHFEISSLMS